MKSLANIAHDNKNVTLRSIIELTSGSYQSMTDEVTEKLAGGYFVTTCDDSLTVGPVDANFAVESVESAKLDDGWRFFDSEEDAASSFIKKYLYSCSL